MEQKNKLLTSVNVDKQNHKEFKILCIQEGITFQLLVNIAVEMYLKDLEFRKLIKKK